MERPTFQQGPTKENLVKQHVDERPVFLKGKLYEQHINTMQNYYHRKECKTDTLNTANASSGLQSIGYDRQIAGMYDLEDTLGRGHFAVVKLARHVFTGEKVAVKVIDKSKLDEISKAHLFQEIRCMKLVQHPNVVRLYEVIDTATKLYLVLELGDGGDLYEYILKYNTGLPERIAKEYFRQIVKAIAYCHQLHVVHRDLKPENVVFFKKQGVVKLTDFGFSNKFNPGQKLQTSCGSLAYSAPEILLGDSYEAPAVDVWSLGVILYMLVCGRPPFQEANDSETLIMIMDCKYDIPNHVSVECKRLISRMLIRSPEKRADLIEITRHPWLTEGKPNCSDMLPLVSKEQPSEEDQNFILQKMVNGDIGTKEEILDCLEKNAYNHITATYYLLAERKLRSKRQELANRNKRPEQLMVQNTSKKSNSVKPLLLTVPRTPGDLPQRNRKCSIVQEDDEEEMSSCSRQVNLGLPINRRGSRSEGRLNLTIQERIIDYERKRLAEKVFDENSFNYNTHTSNNQSTLTKVNVHSDVPYISTAAVSCPNRLHDQRKLKTQNSRLNSDSDTSDDDSEKRKKEVLTFSSKSYQIRRNSDDSSDSQEPGACSTSSKIEGVATYSVSCESNRRRESDQRGCRNKNRNQHIREKNIMQMQQNYVLNRMSELQEDIILSPFSYILYKFIPKMKTTKTLLQDSKKNTKVIRKEKREKGNFSMFKKKYYQQSFTNIIHCSHTFLFKKRK